MTIQFAQSRIQLAQWRISSLVLHARDTFGAMLVALLAESLLLLGTTIWLTRHLSAPPIVSTFGPIELDLTKLPTPEPTPTAPPPPAPAVAEREPPADAPVPEQSAQEQPVPLPEQPSQEAPIHRIAPSRPVPESGPPLPDLSLLPHEQAARAGPLQPAPPWANGQTNHLNEFFQQLNAALRSASHYPEEARGMKLSGRVYMRVHYRDGKVWAPSIVRSSGFAILDQAVLDGVAHAVWPPPPPELKGREIVVPIMGSFW